MKTTQKYIYEYETHYLIRFRNETGTYIQKTFGYALGNKKEVLSKAIRWRDENLPEIRKSGKRMLQNKPQKNKKNKLPAGICLSFKFKNTRKRKYKYSVLSISAGKDTEGKAILRTISIRNYPNLSAAVEVAKKVRVNLLAEYKKSELKSA